MEQELKGEGIERRGKGRGWVEKGGESRERSERDERRRGWREREGRSWKRGLKKERTSRDHRASELLYSSRVNAIYA